MVVYKTVGEVEIKAWVRLPQGRGPFPVMIYIHGGGWNSAMAQGRASSFSRMSAHMARLGIAGVQIFYRGKQTATINDTAADVMDAVEWVRQNAAKYDFDVKRLGMAGSSAGGHLATLVGQWSPECVCVVAISGVYDIPLLMAEWEDRHKGEKEPRDPRSASHYGTPRYWGDENNIRKHSPAHQLRSVPPKTLLVHGSEDTTVPYVYADLFVEKIRAQGGEAEHKLFKGAPHRFHDIPNSPFYEPSMKAVEAFLVKAFGI